MAVTQAQARNRYFAPRDPHLPAAPEIGRLSAARRDLEEFARQRRTLFYPKADLPLPAPSLDAHRSEECRSQSEISQGLAAACRQVFRQVPLAVDSLAETGTFHRLFRVALPAQSAVIARVHAHPHLGRDFPLCIDPWVMDLLRANRLPALTVHRVDLSRELVPFDYEILETAAGRPLTSLDHDDGQLTPVLRQLGQTVARLHEVRLRGFGLLDVTPLVLEGPESSVGGGLPTWRDYILVNLREHVAGCAAIGAITAGEAERIESHFEALAGHLDCMEPVLLHGDLGSHNVFTDGQRITALIDWEDCLAGDPVFDIAFWATFHPARRHAAFLEGYRSERALPADFAVRFWLYFLRVALAKTVLRQRLGIVDRPGRPPASRRIQQALEQLERPQSP